MNEDVMEIIQELIPQIEAQIHKQFQRQYENKIKQIELHYQRITEKLLKEKQQEIRVTYQKKKKQNSEAENLLKKVAILETQRNKWVTQQLNYQQLIKQLTEKISQYQKNQKEYDDNSQVKNSLISDSLNSSFQKSQMLEQISSLKPPPTNISKWKKNSQLNPINQRKEQKQQKKVEKEIIEGSENKLSDYISVLGPPKAENSIPSLQQKTTKGNSLFWSQDKKKQLLKMIKFK